MSHSGEPLVCAGRALVLAMGLCAGCPAPHSVSVVAPAKPAAAPIVTPARWVLAPSRGWRPHAALDLGAGTRLLAGERGQRWLDRGDGRPSGAPEVLPEDLMCALPHESKLVFVGVSGATYVTATAAGNVIEKHAPPGSIAGVACGRRALITISPSGVLQRSADAGRSWSPIGLAKTVGTPTRVALTTGGDGLILLAPQRVMLSRDDGASWSAIATPGIGARSVLADSAGSLFLEGALERAELVLAGEPKLSTTKKSPSLDMPPLEMEPKPSKIVERAFMGSRVLLLARAPRPYPQLDRWSLGVGVLGGSIMWRDLSVLDFCQGAHVAGQGESIALTCETASLVKVFRSDDLGATFRHDGAVDALGEPPLGKLPARAPIVVGPNGWLFLNARCQPAVGACPPPRLRPIGGQALEEVLLAHAPAGVSWIRGKTEILRVLPPNPNRLALALVVVDGTLGLYGTRANLASFERLLEIGALDLSKGLPELAADEEDGLVIIWPSSTGWQLLHVRTDGTEPKRWSLPEGLASFALAGKRGLAIEQHGHGWETSDGGVHWTKVAMPTGAGARAECGDYGCMVDEHVRVGWGVAGVATELEQKEAHAAGDPPAVAANPGGAPVRKWGTALNCTVVGKPRLVRTINGPMIPESPGVDAADLAPSIDWAESDLDYRTSGPQGVKIEHVPLPKGGRQALGVVSVDYAYSKPPREPDAPYDVEPITANVSLAYWTFAKRAIVKGAIPKLRVDRPRWMEMVDYETHKLVKVMTGGGTVDIVHLAAEGLYFRPGPFEGASAPIYLVRHDGKVETISGPKESTPQWQVTRSPKGLVAFHLDPQLELMSTLDQGATWTERWWGLAPSTTEPMLVEDVAAGKLVVSWPKRGEPGWVGYEIPLSTEGDPSSVTSLPPFYDLGDPPRACSPELRAMTRIVVPSARGRGARNHPVIVEGLIRKSGDKTKDGKNVLATGDVTAHLSGTEACVGVMAAEDPPSLVSALIPLHDLGHAVVFERGYPSVWASDMRCSFQPGPAPQDAIEELEKQ